MDTMDEIHEANIHNVSTKKAEDGTPADPLDIFNNNSDTSCEWKAHRLMRRPPMFLYITNN